MSAQLLKHKRKCSNGPETKGKDSFKSIVYVDHTKYKSYLYPGTAGVIAVSPAVCGQGAVVSTLDVGDGGLVTLTAPPITFGRIM